MEERSGSPSPSSTIGFAIRPIRDEEFEEVAAMSMSAYRGLEGYCLTPTYETQIASVNLRAKAGPHATVLVAASKPDGDAKEKILGTITYISGPGEFAEVQDEDAAGMRVLAISPEVQKQGVGRALVCECVRRAKEDPTKRKVVVMTCEWMPGAVRLYQQEGFVRRCERDKHASDKMHCLYFELPINQE